MPARIRCRVPHAQEYLFSAGSESEAEAWHDALRASMKAAEIKTRALLEQINSGSTMHKYNYSNSKRSRRFFWVQKDELRWGRAKTDTDSQNVNLKECLGIVYGPMTTTFQRCDHREDPDWACFSLLFTGRTLDLAVAGDLQIHAWLLGLQHLAQAQQLTESNEQMGPQAKDAGKSERSLKKLQAKLDECESRKRSLEQELGLASATMVQESGALTASSAATQVAQSRGQELQQRVRELEAQLKNPQEGQAHKAALENKKHDEAIARAEQEKLQLTQKLEALEQEHKRTQDAEKQLLERLSRCQKVQHCAAVQ
eukprot:g21837.t1